MKKFLLSLAAVALAGSAWADTYTLVTSMDELNTTDEYIIVCPGVTYNGKAYQWAMGSQTQNNNRNAVSITINDNKIEITNEEVSVVKIEESGNADFPYQLKATDGYLYNAGSKNQLNVTSTKATETSYCTLVINEQTSAVTVTYNKKKSNDPYKLQCYYIGGSKAAPSGQLFSTYPTSQKSIMFYKKVAGGSENPGEPVDPTMSFEPNEIIVNMGSAFESPELTCNSDGAVTYSSSDESVATVDSTTGVITLVAKGSTTITATVAATEKYNEGTASYVLHVNLPLPGISFGEQKEYTIKYGESFTAPTLENPNGVEVSYDSTDPNVATVDAEGNVTIVGIGTTTIIASSEASDKYDYGHASYNLIVKDPNAVTFDFVNETYGMTRYTDGTKYNNNPVIITEGVVTLTIDGGNNRLWSDGLRMYKGAKVTINVATGFVIKDVTYNTTGNASFEGAEVGLDYVISYNKESSSKAIENITVKFDNDIPDSVESINVDTNAPKEYYNLQGVRVANPEKGLYIVRQGGKASKVVF